MFIIPTLLHNSSPRFITPLPYRKHIILYVIYHYRKEIVLKKNFIIPTVRHNYLAGFYTASQIEAAEIYLR